MVWNAKLSICLLKPSPKKWSVNCTHLWCEILNVWKRPEVFTTLVMLININSFVGLKLYQQNYIVALVSRVTKHVLLYFLGSICVKKEKTSYSLTSERFHLTKHTLTTNTPSFAWGFLVHWRPFSHAADLLQPFAVKVICRRQTVCFFCILASVAACISISPVFRHRPWGKSSQ